MRDPFGNAVDRRVAGALALLLALAFSGRPSAADARDMRVVSVGGSITEIVFALGAADLLVAVDSTSLFPPPATELPDVGYMRRLSAEPILALDPAVVFAVADAGPETALDHLRQAGIRIVGVPDVPSPEGVIEKVSVVADALGLERAGAALAARLRSQFAQLDARLAGVEQRPGVLFLLSIGSGAPLAAGRGTAADGIIALAGGRNVVNGFEGYKPLSPEAAVPAAPEFVLVNERTLDALGGRAALLARPEVAATPAGRYGRILVMDGLKLLGFGPRTPQAIAEVAAVLHPGVVLPALTE